MSPASEDRYPWMDFHGTDTPEEEWPVWCAACERYVDEACPACGDDEQPTRGDRRV